MAPRKKTEEQPLEPAATAIMAAFDEYQQIKSVSLQKGGRVENILSTGSLIVDLILGGGFQRGRIADIFGPEGSGKTTLVQGIIASAQQLGIPSVFYDTEHSADPIYMRAIGVDLDFKIKINGKRVPAFHYTQPGPGEDVYRHILRTLKHTESIDPEKPGPPSMLFVVDSFAAMFSEKEDTDKQGGGGLGRDARMHSVWLRQLKSHLKRTGALLLFTNQLRFKIDLRNPGGTFEHEPGGNALKFYADYKIRTRAQRRDNEDKLGIARQHLWISTVKNKTFPPFRACEHEIILGRGLDKAQDAFEFLKAIGKIETRGGRHRILLAKYDTGKTLSWKEFRRTTEDPEFRAFAFKLLKMEKVYGAYFKASKYHNYTYDHVNADLEEAEDDPKDAKKSKRRRR